MYDNPNSRTRIHYPYILDVQNGLLEELETRLVIPVSRKSGMNHNRLSRLTPEISFNDEDLLLMVPQMTSMPANKLRVRVGSLEHFRNEIIGAIDFALTGI